MKKLSINIPTYNRDVFLKKNISIIIDQLRTDDLVNDVEINVSDNASSDTTQEIIRELIDKHPDISITYHRNEVNEGPDVNFIRAMQMANGEYSILFGDDDFFENGSIKLILDTITENSTVSLFLSNRIAVDSCDRFIFKQYFLREDLKSEIFDFSKKNDVRAYFSLTIDHGGILTFISSVIYKTSILKDVGVYDNRCNGTCYSFLYYWWTALLQGKKMMYMDKFLVRATMVGVTNNNYGTGLKRLLVDTEGLSSIANIVFSNSYKAEFLAAVRKPITCGKIFVAMRNDFGANSEIFYNSMSKCMFTEKEISEWRYILNRRNSFKSTLKFIIPNCLAKYIHF